MTNGKIQEAADILWQAYHSHELCDPIRNFIGETDDVAAYQIQKINHERWISLGAIVSGKKIGLTSDAVRKQMGVDQPDFGILYSDKEVANGGIVNTNILHQPKVEGEIAFVLKEDLTKEELIMNDIIQAIDYVLPAIEIVGSRIKNWDIRLTDTIADNASSSHYVLGITPILLKDIDIVNCGMKLSINDKVQSVGQSSACMGNPLNACLWLAQKMVEMGNPLKAGEVILSGALGPFVDVSHGDVVQCTIDGLGIVDVSFD